MNDYTKAALEVLAGAVALLDPANSPIRWVQENYALTADGDTCGPLEPSATCLCLYSAVAVSAVNAGHFPLASGKLFPLEGANEVPGVRDLYDLIESRLSHDEQQYIELDTTAASLIIGWNDYPGRRLYDVTKLLRDAASIIEERGRALTWNEGSAS